MGLAASTPILLVGDRTFDWGDLRIAAWLWGDWQRVERRVGEGLACLRFLEADDSELEPALLETAAAEFRYDRNLVAAEEMTHWLEVRGLDVDEWLGFIERTVARSVYAADLERIVAEYPVYEEEITAAAECEAICSGIILETVRKLAAAAAFASRTATPPAGPTAALDAAILARLAIPGLEPDAAVERAERIAGYRAAYDDLHAAAVTAENLARIVQARHLVWMTVECRLASFATDDAAREAIFCVRDEGEDLSAVARSAGVAEERSTFVLEDLPPDLRERLLSAERGALVGPVEFRGRPTVAIVLEKRPPSLEEPAVLARAKTAALAAAIEREARSGPRFLGEL